MSKRAIVPILPWLAGEENQQTSPITRIRAEGVLVARDRNGKTIVPAPIDYLSWTVRIAGFATDPNLLALHNRVLWMPAPMTASTSATSG